MWISFFGDNLSGGGGDNLLVKGVGSYPPLAWGYHPPSPRIPPYYMTKCRFRGDNTLNQVK